eukprot:COSAG02_NODE_185_length_30442_cov_59.370168_3_plen_198_part_00
MAPRSEDEIARLFVALGWNQSAQGLSQSSYDEHAVAVPEARLARVGARYRVSVTNGARVYSYDGLELSLPVEAPGCLLGMIRRALEAEALDGRNCARSVKLVLDGADARELPAVDSESWEIDMGAALACLVAEMKELGECAMFESAHIILTAEPALDVSTVGVSELLAHAKLGFVASPHPDYSDEVPARVEFPRACL